MAEKDSENSAAWKRFLQQELHTWRPVLTPFRGIVAVGICLIAAFALAGAFTAIGLRAVKYEKRYDDVCEVDSDCTISFDIDKEMKGNIMLKYKLTHYYQNHRRFLESRSLEQLMGLYVDFDGMSTCDPLRSIDDSESPENWILPCGLSALYFFNDTYQFNSQQLSDLNLFFNESGIVLRGDDNLYKPLNSEYTQGHRWLEEYTEFPGGQTNEHFVVWMKIAALPTIINDYARCTNCTIPAGTTLSITIRNNYPTSIYQGEKYLILETETVLGSKNMFMGYSYIVMGSVLFVLLIAMVLERLIHPRKIGDMEMVLNIINANKVPQSALEER